MHQYLSYWPNQGVPNWCWFGWSNYGVEVYQLFPDILCYRQPILIIPPPQNGGGAIMDSLCRVRLSVGRSVRLHYRVRSINPIPIEGFLCPRHSKNGGGALSNTPVHASVRACVRPLSKFGVRSITFERLHWFNSNLVCYIYSIKTQVNFDLGYNPLIFDRVMGLL